MTGLADVCRFIWYMSNVSPPNHVVVDLVVSLLLEDLD